MLTSVKEEGDREGGGRGLRVTSDQKHKTKGPRLAANTPLSHTHMVHTVLKKNVKTKMSINLLRNFLLFLLLLLLLP